MSRVHPQSPGVQWRVLIVFVILSAAVSGVVFFALVPPGYMWLQRKISGKSAPQFIEESFGPPIELRVGVEIDGAFHGGDDTVYAKAGTLLVPAFRVTEIDPSEVSEVSFMLDDVTLPNEPFNLEARRTPYILKASGRSKRHSAHFSATCIIFVSDGDQASESKEIWRN